MLNYPLKFDPILKEKIWGGEKLNKLLHKKSEKKNIGESWEISSVDENLSIVSNGVFKGNTLQELIVRYKADLVGDKVYQNFGDKFPLLIKFIDAKEALSIQLHPNNELAMQRHNSFGKTEIWYVMQADKNANLIVGFKKELNKEEYVKHLESKTLIDILNIDLVNKGDVYFIPTGRVHAIGAGVLLAEIQQTSDITYRIYDWDRQDNQGNSRELHTEFALDAMDLSAKENYKTSYIKKLNKSINIADCQYFTVNILLIDGKIKINNSKKNSFVIYMCVSGEGVGLISNEFNENISYGETILMPASVDLFELQSKSKTELLEIYITE
jgi:mannose-6-phosphate isomerase